MVPDQHPDPARDLAAAVRHEERWLERLAGRLTRDPEAAAEAVQETWVAALQRGPVHGSNPRGWLARVAHNAVRKARRSAAHRADRELAYGVVRRAERSDADPARDTRLRLDLDDAVASLAPDVRRAIVLRYAHGYTLREVGHALHLPLSTVDERIRRGLGELRRRLGPERWASALLCVWRPQRARTSSTLLPTLMLTGATVCALVAASVTLWRSSPPSLIERTGASASALVAEVARAGAAPPAVRALLEERVAVAPAATGALIVSVHDDAGAPVVGVHVRPIPVANGRRAPLPASQRTDAGGHAAWRDLAPGRYEVRADRFLVPAVEVGATGTTRIARRVSGPPLTGIVVDRDGQPVPGAEVWLAPTLAGALRDGRWVNESVDTVASVTSDTDGRFALAARGDAVRIGARAAGHAPSPPLRLGRTLERSAELVLRVGADDGPGPGGVGRLAGRVLDAAGRPVHGAAVTASSTDPTASEVALVVLSGTDGAFELTGLGLGPTQLVVDAPGLEPWRSELVMTARTSMVDVQLADGHALSGRVVERDGRAAPNVWVTAQASADSGASEVRRTTRTDGDGTFIITGLARRSPALEVHDDDDGAREIERVKRSDDGALELVLRAPLRATGRVVDETGRALTDCEVRARGVNVWEVVSTPIDAWGHFSLRLPSTVSSTITVAERGNPIHTVAVTTGRDLTIVVPDSERPNARVRGRVVPPPGVALQRVTLVLQERCSATRHTASLDLDDGVFVSDLVPSGEYRLSLSSELAATDVELDVHLTPHADISLGAVALAPTVPCEWSIDVAGTARGLRAALRRADGEVIHSWAPGDATGTLTLAHRVLPGEYTWVVWSATTVPEARGIEVAASGSQERMELELAEPCVLVLRRCEGERAPSPASLSVALLRGEEVVPLDVHPSFREQGAPFVLEVGLPPGPHRLRVGRDLDGDGAQVCDDELSFDVGADPTPLRRVELSLSRSSVEHDRNPARAWD